MACQISVEDCSTQSPSFHICIGLLADPRSFPLSSNRPARALPVPTSTPRKIERRGVVVAAAVDISTEEGEEGEERETREVCCFSLREDNRGALSDHGLLKPDISQICCDY